MRYSFFRLADVLAFVALLLAVGPSYCFGRAPNKSRDLGSR